MKSPCSTSWRRKSVSACRGGGWGLKIRAQSGAFESADELHLQASREGFCYSKKSTSVRADALLHYPGLEWSPSTPLFSDAPRQRACHQLHIIVAAVVIKRALQEQQTGRPGSTDTKTERRFVFFSQSHRNLCSSDSEGSSSNISVSRTPTKQ